MAITKVINDAVDLNQASDYSGLRLPVGTTGDVIESFTTDYLVVGGGGGSGTISGAGGAGGLRTSYNNSTTTTNSLSFPSGKTAIATYMLDNNATDISGNYNGTETNITYNTGKYGGAAVFNGSSSYVDLGSTIDDPLRTAGEFGVSLWFNASSYGTDSVIFKLLNDIYVYIFLNASNQLECRVVNSSGVASTITTSVSLNTWHHVVWTGNSTNGVTLYLNGSSVGNTPWNGTFFTYTNTTYKLNILGYNGGGGGYYDGKIDQVRIYDTALISNDVTNIYNNEVQANSGGGSAAESSLTLTEGVAYDVTVGAGGTGVNLTSGNNGGNSIFSTITSLGGGFGGLYNGSAYVVPGNGGSGGGGSLTSSLTRGNGTLNQGYEGGYGDNSGPPFSTGGGGGAASPGQNSPGGNTGGTGGAGLEVNIIGGSGNYYAGGGGGAGETTGASGGIGGGGDGSGGSNGGEDGAFNTGGGAGGWRAYSRGFNGGSGVVILRYPTASVSSLTTTGTLNTPSTTDTLASAAYPVTNAAYYKLDGDAADSSGNGYTGVASNVTWQNGRFNQAGAFNGSSSYIDTGYNFGVDSSYSVSVWAKTIVTSTRQSICGVLASNGSDVSGRMVMGFSSLNNFEFYIANGSTFWQDTSVNALPYLDGNWHNYVLVVNGTSVKLYVDGNTTPIANLTSTVSAGTATADNLVIGRFGSFPGVYFNGSIDQVRIYSTALTSSQVTELYEEHYQTKFTDGSDTAILFTEGTGTVTFSGANPTPPQGAIRTNTSYSEDGSASAIEHYNGTEWKYFDAIKYCTTNTLNFPSGAGCIASYNLDNNVNDIGNTYNGVNSNVTFTASGKFGAAAVFNGSSSYINLNHNTTYSDLTISAWVNVTSTSSRQKIVGKWWDGSNRSITFMMDSGGVLRLLTSSTGADTVITTGGTLTANTWHFVCFTFQNGGDVTITLDSSTTTTTQNTSINNNNQNWLIGMEDYRGGDKWNGSIDQVRIYPTALTSSQVGELYNNEIACS